MSISVLERKVDMILQAVAAEDADDRNKALEGLRAMLRDDKTKVGGADKSERIKYEIESLLTEIGMPCHICGYYDVLAAIQLAVEQPEILETITSGLYPKVAQARGDGRTKAMVERATRRAIEVAWDRCDTDTMWKYFGNTVSYTKGKPTNSEFIATMAREVQRRV